MNSWRIRFDHAPERGEGEWLLESRGEWDTYWRVAERFHTLESAVREASYYEDGAHMTHGGLVLPLAIDRS